MNTHRGVMLLVEKDPIQAYALELNLIELGYEVVSVCTASAALRLCRGKMFDLAIISQGPRDIRWCECLARRLFSCQLLPSLVLSSVQEFNDDDIRIRYGGSRVMRKPYSFSGCRRLIAEILSE